MNGRLWIIFIGILVFLIIIGKLLYNENSLSVISVYWGITVPLVINLFTFLIAKSMWNKKDFNVTRGNIVSFILRVLFYGIAIVIITINISIEKIPFILSFTVTFILLTLSEALYFRNSFLKQKSQ